MGPYIVVVQISGASIDIRYPMNSTCNRLFLLCWTGASPRTNENVNFVNLYVGIDGRSATAARFGKSCAIAISICPQIGLTLIPTQSKGS